MASGSEIAVAAVNSVAADGNFTAGLASQGGVSGADVVLKWLTEYVNTGAITEAFPGVAE